MLSAPPGSFKTRVIRSLESHDRVLIMSDINVPTITRLRDDVAYGKYKALAFTEFEKLYQRDPGTAANVEGHLRAFVDEGFRNASFKDQRMFVKTASCMVIGALTPTCYQKNFSQWDESGFGRRFLWLHYGLANPGVISEAIHRWERIKFQSFTVLNFGEQHTLDYNVSEKESKEIQHMLPVDSSTSYVLLKKIACVLKHAFGGERAMEIIRDVAPCFKQGGTLYLENADEGSKSHSGKKTRSDISRGPVRKRNKVSNGRTKARSPKVRIHGLEAERGLPAVSETGMGDHQGEGREGEVTKVTPGD
jgi:hypothetical protein